ncbi:MAG: NAD-dependent epimerase/dehydratase family protein, partial [Saprospiraceae bacterium]|nr:NAD-dependent epimerase/dehydratase family protein [Saprospiraceae bacterium]
MDRMSLTNSKVLITGGNGYLGNCLSQKLIEIGADVSILDVKGESINTYHVDITDKGSVREAVQEIDPDIVFHLAASLNRKRDFTIHDEVMAINYG